MRNKWLIFGIIIAAAFLVYSNTFKNEFIYDDESCIVNNTLIKDWKNLPKLFSKDYFSLAGERSYRPILTLSFFVDYSLYKLNVSGWHFTNILLHSINGILVFLLVSNIIKRTSIAVLTSLFFVVHPINSEAVNALSFREDLLSFCFFIIAFLLYIKKEKNIKLFITSSFLSYIFALLSKEMAITLPFAIIAYLYCFDKQKIKKDYFYLIIYFIITLFYVISRYFWRDPAPVPYPGGSIFTAMMTFSKVIVYYSKLLIYPSNLSLDYGNFLLTTSFDIWVILSIITLIIIIIAAVKIFKFMPELSFALFYFFVTLIPVSNIIPVGHIMAERYLYFSSISFFFLLSIGTTKVYDIMSLRKISIFLTAFLVIFYGLKTFSHNVKWKNGFTIWNHSVECRANSTIAQYNLGVAYGKRKEYANAIQRLETALKIDPYHIKSYSNLIDAYGEIGEYDKAILIFNKAVSVNPNYADLYINLGKTYTKTGGFNQAANAFNKAIEINPEHAEAYYNLGTIYNKIGNFDQSITSFNKAIQIDPNNAETYNNLGNAYKSIKDYKNAHASYTKAIEINPLYAQAYNNLGVFYYDMNEFEQAIISFDKAIEIEPSLVDAYKSLSIIYSRKKDFTNAIKILEMMIEKNPEDPSIEQAKQYLLYLTHLLQ